MALAKPRRVIDLWADSDASTDKEVSTMSDGKVAKDINDGKCLFCSGAIYYCNKDGKIANETTDWVVCENDDCMRPGSAINAIQFSNPDKCEECSIEPDCDCEDSDDDDDDESTSGDAILDEDTTQAVVNRLHSLTKSAIMVDGKFQPVDEDVMRETIQEVLTSIEDNSGITPDA